MNGITIDDRNYIFTTESEECKYCALNLIHCSEICLRFADMTGSDYGVFKELKMEK